MCLCYYYYRLYEMHVFHCSLTILCIHLQSPNSTFVINVLYQWSVRVSVTVTVLEDNNNDNNKKATRSACFFTLIVIASASVSRYVLFVFKGPYCGGVGGGHLARTGPHAVWISR